MERNTCRVWDGYPLQAIDEGLRKIMDWLKFSINAVGCQLSCTGIKRLRTKPKVLGPIPACGFVDSHYWGLPSFEETAVHWFQVSYNGLAIISSWIQRWKDMVMKTMEFTMSLYINLQASSTSSSVHTSSIWNIRINIKESIQFRIIYLSRIDLC